MKKTLSLVLFVAVIVVLSCGTSPRDTLIGTWMDDAGQIGLVINADGTIYELEAGRKSNEGTWKLSESAPWILSIYENGRLEVEINVNLINDNEVEFTVEDETIKMKRKQ
jgi:hypothetical protein